MHEVGLVGELVDAAVERSGGRRVILVRVRRATTVPEDVLAQAFEMLVPGTLLDGATTYAVFAEIPGIASEFVFEAGSSQVLDTTGSVTEDTSTVRIQSS